MNEDNIVQVVDEKACAVVVGGHCEDEKPHKAYDPECSTVVVVGDKYQHENQEEAVAAADTDKNGSCSSSPPPPPLPSTSSCDLDNRAAAVYDNKVNERQEEEKATNDDEQWPPPPPSLPLEMVNDDRVNNKDKDEGGGSRDVEEQDERPSTQNDGQHPPPHETMSAPTIEASQWSMYIDSVSGRPYFVSHETGESMWTRPMGPGGVPLPVETSSLGQQYHQFQMFHHSRVCEKNQAHSKSSSFTSAADTGRLGSILDKIDGTAPSRWYKVPDPQGNGEYYADAVSGHTQWEQPSDYDEHLEEIAIATAAARAGVDIPAATCAALPPDASKYIDYSQSATFNSKSGRFGGRVEDGDYWQRVGLGPDRETRQMYHYFDVSKLDENRQDAEKKKRRLNQRGKLEIDWKAYGEKKKKERVKRRNAWVYGKD